MSHRIVSAASCAAIAVGALVTIAPAAHADGLVATGSRQNIPDNASCGDNGERWVKFTTGGPVRTAEGTAKSGQPKWKATYTAAPGEITITSVTDVNGAPVRFSAVAGGARNDNPVWSFARGYASPLLSVPNPGNFSQFALCAAPIILS